MWCRGRFQTGLAAHPFTLVSALWPPGSDLCGVGAGLKPAWPPVSPPKYPTSWPPGADPILEVGGRFAHRDIQPGGGAARLHSGGGMEVLDDLELGAVVEPPGHDLAALIRQLMIGGGA